jgi:hypothetical protein
MIVQPRRLLPDTELSGHCGWHYELGSMVQDCILTPSSRFPPRPVTATQSRDSESPPAISRRPPPIPYSWAELTAV